MPGQADDGEQWTRNLFMAETTWNKLTPKQKRDIENYCYMLDKARDVGFSRHFRFIGQQRVGRAHYFAQEMVGLGSLGVRVLMGV